MAKEASSLTKWPVSIRIQPVMELALLEDRFSVYFVTGIMTSDQRRTITERMPGLRRPLSHWRKVAACSPRL